MPCILAHSLKVAVIHWFDGVGVFSTTARNVSSSYSIFYSYAKFPLMRVKNGTKNMNKT